MTDAYLPPIDWLPKKVDRVLALAKKLSDDLDAIDLDQIDGEFYWRFCYDVPDPRWRLALLIDPADFQRLAGSHQDSTGTVEAPASNARASDALYEQLEIWLQQIRDSVTSNPELVQWLAEVPPDEDDPSTIWSGVPEHVWQDVLVGHPIRMSRLEPVVIDVPGKPLRVFIFASRLTGGDLLPFLTPSYRAPTEPKDKKRSTATVSVTFSLVKSLGKEVVAGVDPPYIEVAIQRPIPPPELIAQAYDAVVREERKWHDVLSGKASRQDKQVAIRTWATRFLMSEEQSFSDADDAVKTAMRVHGGSQEARRQSFNILLVRVPKAKRCLAPRPPDA